MSFDWIHYLVQAKALQCIPNAPDLEGLEEASFRTAVSRAYYAAYHCAEDFACNEGFEAFNIGKDHKRVEDHFRVEDKPTSESEEVRNLIATTLNDLRRHRRDADYREVFQGTASIKAELAVRLARDALAGLDELRKLGIGSERD